MVGRPGFEPGIPWSLAGEHEFARPKPGIIFGKGSRVAH